MPRVASAVPEASISGTSGTCRKSQVPNLRRGPGRGSSQAPWPLASFLRRELERVERFTCHCAEPPPLRRPASHPSLPAVEGPPPALRPACCSRRRPALSAGGSVPWAACSGCSSSSSEASGRAPAKGTLSGSLLSPLSPLRSPLPSGVPWKKSSSGWWRRSEHHEKTGKSSAPAERQRLGGLASRAMPPAPQLQQELSEGKGGREEDKKLKKLLSLPESNSLKRKEGNAGGGRSFRRRSSEFRPFGLRPWRRLEWCRWRFQLRVGCLRDSP